MSSTSTKGGLAVVIKLRPRSVPFRSVPFRSVPFRCWQGTYVRNGGSLVFSITDFGSILILSVSSSSPPPELRPWREVILWKLSVKLSNQGSHPTTSFGQTIILECGGPRPAGCSTNSDSCRFQCTKLKPETWNLREKAHTSWGDRCLSSGFRALFSILYVIFLTLLHRSIRAHSRSPELDLSIKSKCTSTPSDYTTTENYLYYSITFLENYL